MSGQKRNLHLTVYNMEVVILLAFRLNPYQARAVRRELTVRISRDHKPFEVVMIVVLYRNPFSHHRNTTDDTQFHLCLIHLANLC